jgi:dTDP-4-dehydrorhamnose 3,5-epimerase
MELLPTKLPGVLLIQPKVFGDARGFFTETYNVERYREAGIRAAFVQDNLSRSRKGTLRGLHLQHPHAQGKLVWVPAGAVLDVAVDVRIGSPTFGKYVAEELSSENHRQLWVPPGFAHGFQVLSDDALFAYKCTDLYHPEHELGVRYDDPEIGIPWPLGESIVSPKDLALPRLSEIDRARLPRFRA